ncbi:MAG: dephospho-CoA kinase, partial [Clostridia bacterium]|nr:dephospho-CoA kinase [Clostridia bacterium]
AEHIDADEIVKSSQRKGEEYYKKIVENFGNEILQDNRRIR